MTGSDGRMMADIARTALREVGRADLAHLVFVSNDRPIVNWSGIAQPPGLDDVRVVHAALRRAYQACAPDEIGEAAAQFTDDAEHWYRAILGARLPVSRRTVRRSPAWHNSWWWVWSETGCTGDRRLFGSSES